MTGAILAGLCVWTGAGAIAAGLGCLDLPYPLGMLRLRAPLAFPLHMVSGGLGLMLAAASIGLRRRPRLHRRCGQAAAALLALASVTAIPLAWLSTAPTAARAAFLVQAIACLGCLGAGIHAIRRGHHPGHRRAMLSAGAIAFGAVALRVLLLATDSLGLPAAASYAASAWLAWLLPLAVVNLWPTLPSRAGTAIAGRLLFEQHAPDLPGPS